MKEALKRLIDIQNFDVKMLRLMRVKKERQKELEQINDLRQELREQLVAKEQEVQELSAQIRVFERRLEDIEKKFKTIEEKQLSVKKADEFNALNQEMTAAERDRLTTEQKMSDLVDKRNHEEELLEKIRTSSAHSEESSVALEKEIRDSIALINQEGLALSAERAALARDADPESLRIYERLLKNKKDRVVVPIENRICSGCHIALTAQHENVVRKGDNLVFCEHCSRIHYWEEPTGVDIGSSGAGAKRRRRRSTAATS